MCVVSEETDLHCTDFTSSSPRTNTIYPTIYWHQITRYHGKQAETHPIGYSTSVDPSIKCITKVRFYSESSILCPDPPTSLVCQFLLPARCVDVREYIYAASCYSVHSSLSRQEN